jgi:hypothetical protein
MVPLTAPWMLAAGAIGSAALVAIYLFQRRHREREVSSLLLWAFIRTPSSGGRTKEPLRFPLTFWLELAALLLLALAAAAPLIPSLRRTRPLVVVLDDSLSMQLARDRAMPVVERELNSGEHAPVRIILAGETPILMANSVALHWTCRAPTGDLDAAIALALRSAGPTALILVVTDHAPPSPLQQGRLKWMAFGEPLANLAFTGAARSASEHDRATFEIANFADRAQSTDLAITASNHALTHMRIELAPRARRRVDYDIPTGTAAIDAAISGGAAFDDRVTLLPERRPPVRVRVDITDTNLRDAVTNALDASQRAQISDNNPELEITDHPTTRPPTTIWRLELITTKATAAYIGPFTIDHAHPLADGVALEGVIWGAGGTIAGRPIVIAGNRALMTESDHVVRIALDPATSNLQRSTAWPSLIWNLLEWRSASAPGFRFANVPLGGSAIATIDDAHASVRAPDGTQRDVAPPTIVVAATQTGTWSLHAGNATYRFACNALLPDESDFAHAARGTWGGWSTEAIEVNGYVEIAPIVLLLALAMLVMQQRVTAEAT